MAINKIRAQQLIKERLTQNPALLKELNIDNPAEVMNLTDQQLETLLSPKLLGLLSIDKKDLEL